jgi:hypothetical protein
MADEIRKFGFPGEVILVRFKDSNEPSASAKPRIQS